MIIRQLHYLAAFGRKLDLPQLAEVHCGEAFLNDLDVI